MYINRRKRERYSGREGNRGTEAEKFICIYALSLSFYKYTFIEREGHVEGDVYVDAFYKKP